MHTLMTTNNLKSRLVFALALILTAFMLLASISPVRAFVQELLTTIAGQSFEETEEFPGAAGGGEHIVYPQMSPLDEALEIFPYSVRLPTYIPEGFILDEQDVSLYTGEKGEPFSETIMLQWKPEQGMYLTLYITDHDWSSSNEVVAPGAAQEVLLADGNPAVLIRGGWDVDRKAWVDDRGSLRLRWSSGNLNYDLHGNATNVTIEQLIAIASSTLE